MSFDDWWKTILPLTRKGSCREEECAKLAWNHQQEKIDALFTIIKNLETSTNEKDWEEAMGKAKEILGHERV